MTTAGQKRALRELCALTRTALGVCEMIAARGEEHDDRPRLWLLALERWTRGAETGPQLAAATRAMGAWAKTVSGGASVLGPSPETAQHAWWLSCAWLADARVDLLKNPGHGHHTPRVCGHLADTIMRAEGQPCDAARAMVVRMLREERERVAGEWAAVMREASAARAKADKVTAERARGTLPGMVPT